jgi:lipopolysaccharide export system protein LptA
MRHMIRVLLLLLLQLPLPVLALSSDREQPIHIKSDRLDIDEVSGISTYQGNVQYTQGTIIMDADIMIVHTSDGQLNKLEAFGDPAHYRQKLDHEDGNLSAEAKSMEYVSETEKLILRENVHVLKGENVFTGNIVEYNTKDEIVSARKAETGKERVQVIIQPRNQANETGSE